MQCGSGRVSNSNENVAQSVYFQATSSKLLTLTHCVLTPSQPPTIRGLYIFIMKSYNKYREEK